MKPTDLWNHLKSPSGRLLVFAALLGGGLALYGTYRARSHSSDLAKVSPQNQTDTGRIVQTFHRPMEPFRPPPPVSKVEPLGPTVPEPKSASRPEAHPVLSPITLVADTATGDVRTTGLGPIYAPYGRLIPCQTVITIDSSSIQTPIIGLVTEDIHHGGHLVIPAGTEVHGSAQTDRARERIASGSAWTLVWRSGEELRLRAIALDREFDTDQSGWGITDGSAGLRGRLIKSDDLAEIKLFAATFLSGAAKALTEKETTLFGAVDSRSLNNAPLKGAEDILELYARRIHEEIQRSGFYVRVPSGKQFYLYVLQTIDRDHALLAGSQKPGSTAPDNLDTGSMPP